MYKSIHAMALTWFAYIGGNPMVPGSYVGVISEPTSCILGCTICAIGLEFDNGPGSPADISEVIDLIPNALATKQNQAIGLQDRVRMKDCG